MKILVFIFFFVSTTLSQEEILQRPHEKDVIILDNKNLLSSIYESEDPWLLDMYAPWCGHCLKMLPEWAKLATNLKNIVKVAKIDASKYQQFDEMYKLKSYPHIVFIPGGQKNKEEFQIYKGPKTAEAIQKWTLKKNAQYKRSILQKLIDQKKWQQVCIGSHSDFCVVFFLPKSQSSQSEQERGFYLKIIKDLIKKFKNEPVSYLWTQSGEHPQLQQQLKIDNKYPRVALINPNNKRFALMKKQFTEDNFQNWLNNIFDIEWTQNQGEFLFGAPENKISNDEKINTDVEL